MKKSNFSWGKNFSISAVEFSSRRRLFHDSRDGARATFNPEISHKYLRLTSHQYICMPGEFIPDHYSLCPVIDPALRDRMYLKRRVNVGSLMKSTNFILYLHLLMKWYDIKSTHLYKEPRCDERQAAVLSVKSIMVRVERKVIQVEESETETAGLVVKTGRMTHEREKKKRVS